MELTQLRYFVLVAENGSTAKAAAEAMVSQSTVSKSLLHLERELELKLFDREGNRLVLNPAGREFLQQVRPILTAVDKLPGFVKSRHRVRRSYRINVSAAQPAMTEFARQFLAKEPDAQLLLTGGSWIGDCDLSITATPSARPADNVELLEERVLLALPKGLLPEGAALDLVGLERLPLILPGEGTELRELIDRQVMAMPAVLEVRAAVPETQTLRRLVESGCGAAFWPEKTWLAPDPAAAELHPLAGLSLSRRIYAILPPGQGERGQLLEAVTAFFGGL